ncbi:hypothetical protein [Okeania sp. SIO2C2]|nr:hypothetical protein [Okeania sp. SIO2C2]
MCVANGQKANLEALRFICCGAKRPLQVFGYDDVVHQSTKAV